MKIMKSKTKPLKRIYEAICESNLKEQDSKDQQLRRVVWREETDRLAATEYKDGKPMKVEKPQE